MVLPFYCTRQCQSINQQTALQKWQKECSIFQWYRQLTIFVIFSSKVPCQISSLCHYRVGLVCELAGFRHNFVSSLHFCSWRLKSQKWQNLLMQVTLISVMKKRDFHLQHGRFLCKLQWMVFADVFLPWTVHPYNLQRYSMPFHLPLCSKYL